MDGEAGTTVADRSTAAVEVADEDGEIAPVSPQDGTTPGAAAQDDHNGVSAGDTPPKDPADSTPTLVEEPAGESTDAPADEPADEPTGEQTQPMTQADDEPAPPQPPAGPTAEEPVAERPTTGKPTAAEEPAVDAPAAEQPATEPAAAEAAAEAPVLDKAAAEEPAAEAAGKTAPTVALAGADKPRGTQSRPRPKPTAPDLHSGHRLARRYQLAECVTRVDGFSSWRAVDEKLRRAVGIHLLPADHPRARQVLAAARSAALLGDPRFVQVLDAVEEDELVYVIHEWLPDAASLADLLALGPLEPHEAYQMAGQVAQGMAAAHREGLAHLRLDPGAVLRTSSGQYRIRGLAVAAALRGLSSERPQRQDTEAIGALLYASLTQRWPYEEDAHGLAGLPKSVGLVAPDQLRAGVHRGLSDLSMRALVNDGATASREEPPCTTPEELAKALAAIPRIRPPEHPAPVYRPPAFPQPPQPVAAAGYSAPDLAPVPPPALPGRTGSALKWAVSALLIVAIGLGSWQLADALKSRENNAPAPTPTPTAQQHPAPPPVVPLKITGITSFDPQGDGSEHPAETGNADDGDPSTSWQTQSYTRADLGGLKEGVGLVLDLGSAHRVSSVTVDLVGATDVELLAAPAGSKARPTQLDGFGKVASASGDGKLTFKPTGQVTTRYLLVWLTKLPPSDGQFRGKISEIDVTG
jgi:serine/threonine protein kinase